MLIRADRSLLLATTLVNNTDVYNMDVMAKALANIFHQSGRALDLLVPVIQNEVSKTGTQNEKKIAKFGNNV
jgi:hypothetical protein